MSNYDVSAAHVVRGFLLSKLNSELGWTKVNGLDPIIPLQQEPEMTNSDKPFIVYSYSTVTYGTMWEMCVDNIAFSVYSNNENDIISAMNLIIDLFKRADWSADDVNSFVSASPVAKFKPFDFKTIMVTASSSDGGSQEGGRKSGFVSIRAEYTHLLDNRGLRSTV